MIVSFAARMRRILRPLQSYVILTSTQTQNLPVWETTETWRRPVMAPQRTGCTFHTQASRDAPDRARDAQFQCCLIYDFCQAVIFIGDFEGRHEKGGKPITGKEAAGPEWHNAAAVSTV